MFALILLRKKCYQRRYDFTVEVLNLIKRRKVVPSSLQRQPDQPASQEPEVRKEEELYQLQQYLIIISVL